MIEEEIPLAVKIVNRALVANGQEATFDPEVKEWLICLLNKALVTGYRQGLKDASGRRKSFGVGQRWYY